MTVRVYVAGPYTAPTPEAVQANVDRAVDVGNRLLDLGFRPYVPHLSHYQHARKARHYEEWMALDFAWLEACDLLLRLHGTSSGADREVEHAKRKRIPVVHSIAEVLAWMPRRKS